MATVDEFLAACAAEIGYTESPAGSNKQKFAKEAGHANGAAWCQTFLDAKAIKTGLVIPEGVALTAYTPSAVNAWKKAGRWFTEPEPGDWVYFQFDSDPQVDHVGVVVSVGKKNIETIEGNTSSSSAGSQSNGGAVARRTRARSLVVGYGRPQYDPKPMPKPDPVVIVKDGTAEAQFLAAYPNVFGRPVRVVNRDPNLDVYAAANPDDWGFGVAIWGARSSYVGANRYETLKLAWKEVA